MWLHVLKSNMVETTWLLVNDSQGTLVQSTECEWMSWGQTSDEIFRLGVNDVNPLSKARKPAIEACKFQGTK